MTGTPALKNLPATLGQKAPEAIGVAVSVGFAAWLVASVFSQHPLRSFDRVRSLDKLGVLIPDWRFFSPEPVKEDYVVLFRFEDLEGGISPWRRAAEPAKKRKIYHGLWYPEQRYNRGLMSLCEMIIGDISSGTYLPGRSITPSQLISVLIEARMSQLNLKHSGSYQFAIATEAEYDPKHESAFLFVSPTLTVSR